MDSSLCVLPATGVTDTPLLVALLVVGIVFVLAAVALLRAAQLPTRRGRGAASAVLGLTVLGALALVGPLGATPASAAPTAAECAQGAAPAADPEPTPTAPVCVASDPEIEALNGAYLQTTYAEDLGVGIGGIDEATWTAILAAHGTMELYDARSLAYTVSFVVGEGEDAVELGPVTVTLNSTLSAVMFEWHGQVVAVPPYDQQATTDEEFEAMLREAAASVGVVDFDAASMQILDLVPNSGATLTISYMNSCGAPATVLADVQFEITAD